MDNDLSGKKEQAQGQEVSAAAGTEIVGDVVLVKGGQSGQKGARRDGGQESLGFLLAGEGLGEAAAMDHVGVGDGRQEGQKGQDGGVVEGEAGHKVAAEGGETHLSYGREALSGFAPDARQVMEAVATQAVGVVAGLVKIVERAASHLSGKGQQGGCIDGLVGVIVSPGTQGAGQEAQGKDEALVGVYSMSGGEHGRFGDLTQPA